MTEPLKKSYILLKKDSYELLPCENVEFTLDEFKKAINAKILDFVSLQDPARILNDKLLSGHLEAIVDDNGIALGKPYNNLASALYDPYGEYEICGDVLLGFSVDFVNGEREICPVPTLFLPDLCRKIDKFFQELRQEEIERHELETSSDLQLGRYDVEVMNGNGYYDSDGHYVAFHRSK